MKWKVWLALISVLLLFAGSVQAEGGCPPGMIPYRVNDMSSCGPFPAGQAQAPAVKWQSRWGAIATYEPDGSLGTATDRPSENDAAQTALADCQSKHGASCKVQLTYHDQCAAMVVSDKGYNTQSAATTDIAAQNGMEVCHHSGDPNCHVYYSACSLPKRVQ